MMYVVRCSDGRFYRRGRLVRSRESASFGHSPSGAAGILARARSTFPDLHWEAVPFRDAAANDPPWRGYLHHWHNAGYPIVPVAPQPYQRRVLDALSSAEPVRVLIAGGLLVSGAPAPRPPCTVCGTEAEKHGSYPTCATRPYTPDSSCQYVVGAICVGAECLTGCVRARGVLLAAPGQKDERE